MTLPGIYPQFLGCPPYSLVSIPIKLAWFLHNLGQGEVECHNGKKNRMVACVGRLVKRVG